MLAAGKLRHRVTIRKLISAKDSRGQRNPTYADRGCTVWANVRQVSGREAENALAVHAETTWLIEMRYLPNVEPTDRVTYTTGGGSRTFEVLAAIDPEQRQRRLVIHAKEHNPAAS